MSSKASQLDHSIWPQMLAERCLIGEISFRHRTNRCVLAPGAGPTCRGRSHSRYESPELSLHNLTRRGTTPYHEPPRQRLKYTSHGYVRIKLDVTDLPTSETSGSGKVIPRSSVVLTVTDTGRCISAGFLRSKLFMPFAQENSLPSALVLVSRLFGKLYH